MKHNVQYNIIFALCQDKIWKIANTKHKTKSEWTNEDLKKYHTDENIYIVWGQVGLIKEIGDYICFDIDGGWRYPLYKLACNYDCDELDAMIRWFLEVKKSDFEAHFGLVKKFDLKTSSILKTKARLSAEILEAKRGCWGYEDRLPESLEVKQNAELIERIGNENFEAEVCGLNCSFGRGGIHGAREKYIADGEFVNIDVVSMYPSIMLNYDLLSRGANREKYKAIYQEKLKTGSVPVKIVLNATFGAMNEPHNQLYDPHRFRLITRFGQLFMLDLLEHLSIFEIIQTNTDSVLVKMPSEWARQSDGVDVFYEYLKNICGQWQRRTGLRFDYDYIKRIAQKDVNNYVALTQDGKIIAKGGMTKEQGNYNRHCEILIGALTKKLLYNTPIRQTINECKDIKKFYFYAHVSDKYDGIYLGETPIGLATKVVAGKKGKRLSKRNSRTKTLEKVAGSPEICTRVWGDIDKDWYIAEAEKRYRDFGGV